MRRLAVLLSFSLFFGACTTKGSGAPSTPIVESFPISFEQRVVLPGKSIATESAKAKLDESALSVLIRTHAVETKHFSFGDIANSIDEVAGGTDGKYWILYVNGKMSDVGASEYKIKDGDVITWKFQKEGEKL